MTTLANDAGRTYELAGDRREQSRPVIASDIIYEGAAVGDNGSNYARPLVGLDPFWGFAKKRVDNASGAAGDKNVELWTAGYVVVDVVGVAAETDTDAAVYASDDNTFTLTASGATQIGKIVRRISGTQCVVRFEALSEQSI